MLIYILAFRLDHVRSGFTWAYNLVGLAWALHAPLVLWGFVGTVRAAWHRRFGRALTWFILTAGLLLVFLVGSFPLFVLVMGGAPSVGGMPPGRPAQIEY